MPTVHSFHAIQFRSATGDVSSLVAPPYDVLDHAGKQRLLARDPHNIVAVDLPHTPAKELGPPAAYDSAATTLRTWLADGTLTRRAAPVMFAYRQSWAETHQGATVKRARTGMACCLDVLPFGPRAGGGVLPHEETFSGPKEDRMALMKATRTQLSPIFGLHTDERGRAREALGDAAAGAPSMTATTADGVLHEVWTISDQATIRAYQEALAGEDVFIADGHHRYTTGLNYLKSLELMEQVGADHPARRSMFVLVGMSDPGLVIWPTHRVLGGMKTYSFDAFQSGAAGLLKLEPVSGGLSALEAALAKMLGVAEPRVGVYDFATGRAALAMPATPDPLAARFAAKPKAWRMLDVAFVQYILVEQVCQAGLNGGDAVKWAFPHTIGEVVDIGKGLETGAGGGAGFAQLAVIVRPTPLTAVREVSKANELMPQKSTFFYPKLATGLFVNPLE